MGITKNHIHTEDQIALARLFKALAHPARIAIVENLLKYENLNCKDLGQLIQLSQSTISEHMRQLHEAGILGVRAIENNAFYEVSKTALQEITHYLEQIYDHVDYTFRHSPILYLQPVYSIAPRNFRSTS